MSIVTRRGDTGETSLLFGVRVPKGDLHTEAYGDVDEAISALGVARAAETDPDRAAAIIELQRDLFTVGSELASTPATRARMESRYPTVTPGMVERIDAAVAELEARIPLSRNFIIPGASARGAALDLARTVVRRAERHAATLHRAGELENVEVLRYLNRASDYLFMLARQAESGRSTIK
ncbi:MAG TPA: cob(I)yrinic acid a,c-diamide adenosyltransferase, partial [Actinomycetota bacterium]|nr:cob(I)yrinic acid a,c-diamide adenosyltransferase [Actinomycetota bacterium]